MGRVRLNGEEIGISTARSQTGRFRRFARVDFRLVREALDSRLPRTSSRSSFAAHRVPALDGWLGEPDTSQGPPQAALCCRTVTPDPLRTHGNSASWERNKSYTTRCCG